MIRIVLFVVLGLFLAPTVSIAQTLDWNLIDANKSYLLAPGLASGGDSVRRQAAKSNGSIFEYWDWQSGSMFLQVLPGDRYFDKKRRGDLVDYMQRLDFLKGIGLSAQKSDVKRSKNRFGSFYYLVSSTNNSSLTCLVFLQNMPVNIASGYEESPGSAGGVLQGYDCRPSSEQSASDYSEMVIGYIKSISQNKNR